MRIKHDDMYFDMEALAKKLKHYSRLITQCRALKDQVRKQQAAILTRNNRIRKLEAQLAERTGGTVHPIDGGGRAA